MERIKQYYKLTNIKPKYYELMIPYYKTSKAKIQSNLNELELYYNSYSNMYEETTREIKEKKGGLEDDKVVVLQVGSLSWL
jgi:hypothetical protein